MRLLLDENLDWRLGHDLVGHESKSVQSQGWSGTKNGVLLRKENGVLLRKAIAAGFEVLLTMDNNLHYQQNLSEFPIAIIVLRAHSNQLKDTQPLMRSVLQCLPHASKGQRTVIES